MFKVLKQEKIKKEVIEKYFYMLTNKKIEELKNIFNEEYICEDMKQHIRNLKTYIQLKEMYNKVWKAEEIERFCLKRGISLDVFIQEIMLNGNPNSQFNSIYIDKIKKGKSLYIGGAMKINKEYVDKNAKKFIELSKAIAIKFCNITSTPYSEDKQMEALHIILEKCGNLVYNLSDNPDILYACIFKKVYKSLFPTIKISNEIPVSLTKYDGSEQDIQYLDANISKLEDEDSKEINYQDLSLEEIEIVKCLEKTLVYSDEMDVYSEIAKMLNKSEAEVKAIILKIRGKVASVKEFER